MEGLRIHWLDETGIEASSRGTMSVFILSLPRECDKICLPQGNFANAPGDSVARSVAVHLRMPISRSATSGRTSCTDAIAASPSQPYELRVPQSATAAQGSRPHPCCRLQTRMRRRGQGGIVAAWPGSAFLVAFLLRQVQRVRNAERNHMPLRGSPGLGVPFEPEFDTPASRRYRQRPIDTFTPPRAMVRPRAGYARLHSYTGRDESQSVPRGWCGLDPGLEDGHGRASTGRSLRYLRSPPASNGSVRRARRATICQ